MLSEDDNESSVRAKIVSTLSSQYSLLGPNDFEFVKVVQKKISILRVGANTEYDYTVVKKLAGQGLLYIRIKRGYGFVVGDPAELEEDEESLPESHACSSEVQACQVLGQSHQDTVKPQNGNEKQYVIIQKIL